MESPKSTANMRIGTSGGIGPVWVTPTSRSSQPHWNTATTIPNAAPAENRFMIAAVAGMARFRKTIIRRRNESATTMAAKYDAP
jgi:hypothetical protein